MSQQSQIETWIDEAQRGDRLGVAKALTTCHPQLRAQAEAQMDAALKARVGPDDILQEVYMDVVRQIDRFDSRGPGSFLSWVRAILDNKIVDARRAAHRKVRDIDREVPAAAAGDSYWDLFDHLYADSGTPSRVMRRQEALGALLASLSNLSDSHREILQLRFIEGLSVSDVAKRLGKSEAAVVALRQRALKALREAMDGLGEFTHGV